MFDRRAWWSPAGASLRGLTLCELSATVAVVAVALALSVPVRAQQAAPVTIGNSDICGVVTGQRGAAGRCMGSSCGDHHLPTRMIKMVVTDDGPFAPQPPRKESLVMRNPG